MKRFLLFLLAGLIIGCGEAAPPPPENGDADEARAASRAYHHQNDDQSKAKLPPGVTR